MQRFFATFFRLTLLLCALLCVAVRAGEAESAAALLRQLEDGDFDARKAVEKRLEELGEAARTDLEKAALSASPELRQIAQRLLQQLSQATLLAEFFDNNGKRLADAPVRAVLKSSDTDQQDEADPDADPGEMLKTDAQGRLKFKPTTPGAHYLTLDFTSHAHASEMSDGGWSLPLLLHSGENRLRATLAPRPVLSGKIEREDGTALRDASVMLYDAQTKMNPDIDFSPEFFAAMQHLVVKTFSSGAEGLYTSEGLRAGLFHVLVQHPEYETEAIGSVRLEHGQTIELPPFKMKRRLAPPGTLRFKLQDSNGMLLANRAINAKLHRRLTEEQMKRAVRTLDATEHFHLAEEPHALTTVNSETNAQGIVEFKDIPAGTYDVVLGDEESERLYYAPNASTGAGEAEPPPMKPQTLGSLEGKLTGPNGAGLAGLKINLFDDRLPLTQTLLRNPERLSSLIYSLDEFTAYMQTDEEGKFHLETLTPGSHTMVVLSDNEPLAIVPGIAIELGKKTPAPAIVLNAPISRLHVAQGKVLLSDNSPAAGAMVYLMNEQGSSSGTNTGPDGSFSIQMNGQGTLWLGITTSGYATQILEHKPGTAPLEIVLKKESPGSLRIQAKLADGRPAAQARVHVTPVHQRFFDPSQAKRTTNAVGQLALRNLRPGSYRVYVLTPGHTTMGMKEIKIGSGENVELELKLPAPARLSAKLKLPEGADAALQRAQLILDRESKDSFDAGAVPSALASQGADGRFHSGPLPPGTYGVRVDVPDYVYTGPRVFTLEAGKTNELELALAPACKVNVSAGAADALNFTTLGVAGHWRLGNDVTPEMTQSQISARNDFKGTALLEGVAPGQYDVVLQTAGDDGVNIQRVLTGVKVEPAHAAKPLQLNLAAPEQPASVKGSLACSAAALQLLRDHSQDFSMLTLNVSLTSNQQRATLSVPLSELSLNANLRIFGRPDALPARTFNVEGLAPDEYTCESTLVWNSLINGEWKLGRETITLQGLPPKLTLSAKQKMELPALTLDIPGKLREQLARERIQRAETNLLENLHYATQQPVLEHFQP